MQTVHIFHQRRDVRLRLGGGGLGLRVLVVVIIIEIGILLVRLPKLALGGVGTNFEREEKGMDRPTEQGVTRNLVDWVIKNVLT